MNLKGKTALITGSAKRIGKAIALALAKQGVNVIVHYNHSEKEAQETLQEIHSLDVKGMKVKADLGSLQEMNAMLEEIKQTFPRIDILINNASSFVPDTMKELENDALLEKHFKRAIASNLFSAYALTIKVSTTMKNGHIITMGEMANISGKSYPGYLTHHISKAGLIELTKIASKELAPNVKVNMIANGLILPPESMTQERAQEIEKETGRKWLGVESVVQKVFGLLEDENANGKIVMNDG